MRNATRGNALEGRVVALEVGVDFKEHCLATGKFLRADCQIGAEFVRGQMGGDQGFRVEREIQVDFHGGGGWGERKMRAESDRPVDAVHVARLKELLVHPEDSGKGLRSVSALGHLEVMAEAVAVVRMGALLDDQQRSRSFGSLPRRSAHTLFGHDDLHGVLAVVRMA